MASIIIDHLRMLNQENTLVLSIFCDYRSAAAQTVANLLCSLLKQLVQDHGLSSLVASLYNHFYRHQTRPSLDALTKILSQELKSFDHVYIVLDALDEFTDDNGGREELIETLKSLGDNTHLLVTSRDITTIGFLFEDDIWMDIRAADEDIKTYIMSKLSSGRLARHTKGRNDLCQEILIGVTAKADGMYVAHAVTLLAPIDQPSVGSSWQVCTWIHLLRQRIENYFETHSVNCQTIWQVLTMRH